MTEAALAPEKATPTDTQNLSIQSFHHPAIKCFDAEETRKFYEDVLGLPLNAAVVINDDGRGGDYYFMHVFFRMKDGDFLAFFDKDSEIKPDIFKPYNRNEFRLALRVETDAELDQIIQRLKDAGVEVSEKVDTPFGRSIFFKDPNDLDLELTVPAADFDERLKQEKARAHDVLADWTKKTAAKRAGLAEARAKALAAAAPPGP